MNMTCKIAMDLAELYHADLVSEESAKAIRAHLRECGSCRQYYKEYEAVRRHRPVLCLHPAEDIAGMGERMYANLSKRLRRRRMLEIIGTSAAIGAGTIMLAAGLIMLSKSAHIAD